MVFPLLFPLEREVFGVFTFILSYIFSSYERGFFGFYFFWVLRFFRIFFLLYLIEVRVFLKELDYVELRSIQGRISPVEGQVLHLAGLSTRIGGKLRSNHCNILYIAIIALSLC